MATNFDPNLPGQLEGRFTNIKVTEPGNPALAAAALNVPSGNHVINQTRAFQVELSWEVFGSLTPLWLTALSTFGNWEVKVFAESIGPGTDIQLGTASVAVNKTGSHSVTVNIPANAGLQENNPGASSGIYRLTATAFLNSNLGVPGYDIIGFAEGPMIQVENPV
jgi:hypothetical protein